MYLAHYQLTVKPFDLSPGPGFLWLGEKHEEALSTLHYGIAESLGFLLLTGDVGLGKTALVHRLISTLDSSTLVAHITDPGLGTFDFFKLLAAEFNLPQDFKGKADFLIELEKFLHQSHREHKKVLLIVDEAQRLNNKLLDEIRVLSNIELSDRKLINIFFVGQPEFKKMLTSDVNRAIRQRIAINYNLQPLTESETGQYIHYRLRVAGAIRKIFTGEAIREIFSYTNGYPRAINMICDHALLTGYAAGIKTIDADVIRECRQELAIRTGSPLPPTDFQRPSQAIRPETPAPEPRRSVAWMRYAAIVGVLIISISGLGYFYLWSEPGWSIPSMDRNSVSTSSGRQDEAGVAGPLKVKAPIPAQPTPVESAIEIAPAAPSIPLTAGPETATVAADRVAVAASTPAPAEKAPESGQPDAAGKLTVYEQAEKDLALLMAAPDVHSEAKPGNVVPKPLVSRGDAPGGDQKPPSREISVPGAVAAAPAAEPASVQAAATATDPAPAERTVAAAPVAVKSEPPVRPQPPAAAATTAPPPAKREEPLSAAAAAAPTRARPDPQPEPSVAVPPASELQAALGAAAAEISAEQKTVELALEDRLRLFLDNYSNTYAAKDLDAFTDLFSSDAQENGQPFETLLPVYERNFTVIQTIDYRIELQQFSYDDRGGVVDIEGDFFLRWLPPDQRWRENSGKISMRLKEAGPSFLVQRLDYHGHGSR
ncbi:MAG: AAA family ATPase [Desulfosarcina sp.]